MRVISGLSRECITPVCSFSGYMPLLLGHASPAVSNTREPGRLREGRLLGLLVGVPRSPETCFAAVMGSF